MGSVRLGTAIEIDHIIRVDGERVIEGFVARVATGSEVIRATRKAAVRFLGDLMELRPGGVPDSKTKE